MAVLPKPTRQPGSVLCLLQKHDPLLQIQAPGTTCQHNQHNGTVCLQPVTTSIQRTSLELNLCVLRYTRAIVMNAVLLLLLLLLPNKQTMLLLPWRPLLPLPFVCCQHAVCEYAADTKDQTLGSCKVPCLAQSSCARHRGCLPATSPQLDHLCILQQQTLPCTGAALLA